MKDEKDSKKLAEHDTKYIFPEEVIAKYLYKDYGDGVRSAISEIKRKTKYFDVGIFVGNKIVILESVYGDRKEAEAKADKLAKAVMYILLEYISKYPDIQFNIMVNIVEDARKQLSRRGSRGENYSKLLQASIHKKVVNYRKKNRKHQTEISTAATPRIEPALRNVEEV